jgi:DNA-binding NarL/FixJ family response regulator/class 3 adenylate cyclase
MSRPTDQLGTTIKTFLIADVRGYTRFTDERGDHVAARLFNKFADLTREVVEASGGKVVEFRGDEALAAFESARSAVRAAVQLQARFVEETYVDSSLPLPVGIGLDAGEVVPVGEGYRGRALNLAARLCGLAAPGEALATQEVVHLAGGVEGIRYEERGSVRLKNRTDPVRVVKVAPEDGDPAERFKSVDMGFSAPRNLRVVLADDSVLFREGVARILKEAGCEIVGQAGSAEDILELVRADPPDVAIVDVRMPPTHTNEGLRAAQQIRAEHPSVGVLVLSQYVEAEQAMKLIGDGAEGLGYLLKDRVSNMEEFADAVHRVGSGGSVIDPKVVSRLVSRRGERDLIDVLTDREREVLALMAEGRSNQAICNKLFVSPKTLQTHVGAIFSKLGLPPAPNDHRRVLAVLTFLRSWRARRGDPSE